MVDHHFSQVFPIKSGHWGEEIPQFFIHHAQAFAATYSNAEPATGLGGLERTYLNRVANPIVNPPFKYPFIMIWMTWGMVYYWLYHLIPKIPKMVLLRISYASKTTKRHRYQQAPDTTWYNHSSARRRGLWTHSQMTTGGYDGSRYHGYVAWYWQGTGSVFLTHRSMKSPRACSSLICWCIMVTWCFMPLIAQPLNPLIGGSMEQKPHQFQSTSTSWKPWKPNEACRSSKQRLPSHAWSGVLPPGQAWQIWIGIHRNPYSLLECPEGWRRLCSAKVTSIVFVRTKSAAKVCCSCNRSLKSIHWTTFVIFCAVWDAFWRGLGLSLN